MNSILILINRLSEQPTADEMDVLDQVEAVEKALDELQLIHHREFVDANLIHLIDRIHENPGGIAFNLVESLNDNAGLVPVIPAVIESLNYPFTGNPSEAMFLTTHKPLAKRIMQYNGIPTPGWWAATDPFTPDPQKHYIVKPSREDASVGITDSSVFLGSDTVSLRNFRDRWGENFFIEEFIAGREFNLSVLGGPDGPEVLSPAEIRFTGFPEGKPRIVGYAAKWEEDSFEYRNTVRSFDFPETDIPLLDTLRQLSLNCWQLFHLRGYARVDFRVDATNRPFVLEINANPCISPDSGFQAAALRSGYSFTDVVKRILTDL